MKVYIPLDKEGQCLNVNAFVAREGFTWLGWEVCTYFDIDDSMDKNPETVFVGGVTTVKKRLNQLGITLDTTNTNYPPFQPTNFLL